MEILNSKSAASGEIPACQFGDDWRFVLSQLLEHIANRSISEQLRRQELFKSKQNETVNESPGEKTTRGRRKSNKIDLSGYA